MVGRKFVPVDAVQRLAALVVITLALATGAYAGQPLFDAHLHYNAEDARRFPPAEIIAKLTANNIVSAAVTGRPPGQVRELYAFAPDRIVPVLGVYRTPDDKANWTVDADLPAWLARQLDEGPWRAVGELHLFAGQRFSPVFLRVARLATARGLPLLLHCDPTVIDTVFERVPDATVIWAHAGAYPYPPLLRDYLDRYPRLYADVSVRDERIAPGGILDPDWELLFLEYSDRFMVGVDTYETDRWETFDEVVGLIRRWLVQLPDEVSRSLAHDNAARVLGSARD